MGYDGVRENGELRGQGRVTSPSIQTNRVHERVEVFEPHRDLSEGPTEGAVDILGEDIVVALCVLPTECVQVGGIEVRRGPLALDGHWLVPSPGQDEVNFMSTFVAPIQDVTALATSHHLVQHEVFPQRAEVISTQVLPAAVVRDRPCIKPIHLGCRDNLGRPMGAERANDVCDEGGLQHVEMVLMVVRLTHGVVNRVAQTVRRFASAGAR